MASSFTETLAAVEGMTQFCEMGSFDHLVFWAELDALGEDEVRKRLAAGAYNHVQRQPFVIEWLRQRDQQRADVQHHETQRIARSAKRAGWVAAIAAIIGALVAIGTLVLQFLLPP